jgi:ketosteroid isomerase-like protein
MSIKKMKNRLCLMILVITFNCAANEDKETILSIMASQEKAWNKGDLEEFMQGYWQSEKLAFVGKSGIKHGWQTTLNNYKNTYPDRSAMGQLTFTILEVELTGDTAFVLGKWHLRREKDEPNGHFTLYWKKIKGHWKIVIDHSS